MNKLNHIYLSFSNNCNFRCKYCYVNKDIEEHYHLNFEDIVSFIRKLDRTPDFAIFIFGGEPLLHAKELEEFIKYVNNEFYISIITNGSLLTDEFFDAIKDYRVNVNVSLDGDEFTNDCNRVYCNGTSTYRDVIENIKLFYKHNRHEINTNNKIICKQTINPFNYSGVFNTYRDIILDKNINKYIDFSCSYDRSCKWDDEILIDYEEKLSLLANDYINNFKNNPVYVSIFFEPVYALEFCNNDFCGAGDTILGINFDGDVYPCPHYFDSKWKLGDIRTGLNPELVNNYINSKITRTTICNNFNCSIPNKNCMGVCIASYNENNNICKLIDINFKYSKIVYEALKYNKNYINLKNKYDKRKRRN